MGAHTPASAPHCRQFSEGGPSPTSLPTLRVGHGCSHPGLGPALQTVQWRRTLPHLPAYLAGAPWVLTPRPRPALQTVQWRRTLPHLPAYLAGGPWVLTPRPRPRTADSSVKADPPHLPAYLAGGPRVLTPRPQPHTADSSVKADPPPPPCLPCGWAMGAHTPASARHNRQFSESGPSPPPCLPCGWVMGAHTPASAPHCRQFSEGGPSPTSLPTLRVGHGCSHPSLGPALQTVQWRRTLPHLPAYLAGGPWVLTPPPPPPPRPRTADSSVKADPPPPSCLPCGWAMGAHIPASAPHCRQFSEGGPSPTSLPTLRVGHGCSHPGLGPALQTVQWRRTLPHLPAYLADGPRVLSPHPRLRTADSSVKADPPPPPCLPCGWA